MSWIDRLAGLTGVAAAFYLLMLPGCVCDLWTSSPAMDVEPGDPTARIAASLAASSAAGRTGAHLSLLAVFLLVVFFARLHGALRQTVGPASWLPSLALAGGVLMAAVVLLDSGLAFAAAELGAQEHGAELGRLFVLWGWNSASLFAPPFALALVSTTAAGFSDGLFRPWYRWVSALLLVLLVLAAAVVRAPGLALFPGVVWMFLTAFQLSRTTPHEDASGPQDRQEP